MVRVVHFLRRPLGSAYSLERMFEDVRGVAAPGIDYQVAVNRHASRGLLPRALDLIAARGKQGDVNHITGDIHYVSYLLKRRRTILTIHDCLTLDRLRGWRRALYWLLWFWLPLRRVSHVTVNSQFTKHQVLLHSSFPDERIAVIHPAISEEFVASPKKLDLERPRILHIGSTPNKNLPRVIAALAPLACQLTIIGVVDDDMAALLNRSGLDWESYVDVSRQSMVEHYRRADILMFASTYEGFGMPIAEANAVGRPVIAGNTTAMPEVAADAALLVDPFDVESIRTGVQRLCADRDYCRNLVEAGLRNAERFRVGHIASQYQALYLAIHRDSAP